LRMYWISSCGQPTRGGPPARVLGIELTTPRRKKKKVFFSKCYTGPQLGWLIFRNGLGNRKWGYD